MRFTLKLVELYEEVRISIIKNVADKGVESKFYPKIVMKVDNQRAFNLPNGRQLFEVGQNELIDKDGYLYSFSCLPYDELCELADWLNL